MAVAKKREKRLPLVDTRAQPPKVVIEPPRGWVAINLKELWAYRDLLLFLSWRDIAIRYKQTVLGVSWAIIQPFFSMIVFSLFFGRLAKLPSDGVPYPLFSYAGLLPWQYFASALSSASNSLVGSSQLISKTYFPRLIIPITAVLTPLFDFAIAFAFLGVLMVYYHTAPTWNIAFLPLFILLAMITALGVSLWLSAINVKYRDVRYTIAFLIQLWMYASPVVYSSQLVPQEWRALYGLNPMAGVVSTFRWALLGTATGPDPMLLVSALVALALLVSGAFYFKRMEKEFADVI